MRSVTLSNHSFWPSDPRRTARSSSALSSASERVAARIAAAAAEAASPAALEAATAAYAAARGGATEPAAALAYGRLAAAVAPAAASAALESALAAGHRPGEAAFWLVVAALAGRRYARARAVAAGLVRSDPGSEDAAALAERVKLVTREAGWAALAGAAAVVVGVVLISTLWRRGRDEPLPLAAHGGRGSGGSRGSRSPRW